MGGFHFPLSSSEKLFRIQSRTKVCPLHDVCSEKLCCQGKRPVSGGADTGHTAPAGRTNDDTVAVIFQQLQAETGEPMLQASSASHPSPHKNRPIQSVQVSFGTSAFDKAVAGSWAAGGKMDCNRHPSRMAQRQMQCGQAQFLLKRLHFGRSFSREDFYIMLRNKNHLWGSIKYIF